MSELLGKLVGYTIGVLIANGIYNVGYTIGVLIANGIVMWIYNSVVPDVFGFKPIGYWQLFGLYMVCHYLFKPHSYSKNKND